MSDSWRNQRAQMFYELSSYRWGLKAFVYCKVGSLAAAASDAARSIVAPRVGVKFGGRELTRTRRISEQIASSPPYHFHEVKWSEVPKFR